MVLTMHDILIHINLHKKNIHISYYKLLHRNTILLYMEDLHKAKNPTIYSIVSTHYCIVNLTNKIYSW